MKLLTKVLISGALAAVLFSETLRAALLFFTVLFSLTSFVHCLFKLPRDSQSTSLLSGGLFGCKGDE